ncbi:MAG: radical SAM (seleno)protein TrsS [Thermodesulfobacteriota bacterium]
MKKIEPCGGKSLLSPEVVLSRTESVCPDCLDRVPAVRVARGDSVFLRKTCPRHGSFETVIWRGRPSFSSWDRPKPPSFPPSPLTVRERGCPFDCGLCPEHGQHTCTVILEVTGRCDQGCAFCFASAGPDPAADPDLDTIRDWYERLLSAAGPCHVQLSGGEPTLNPDLPRIIALGRSLGFDFIQLNTNGLRLGRDFSYLKGLKEAGLASVFLQFDGLEDEVLEKITGRRTLERKLQAVAHCAALELGVVLAPRLVPGINVNQIGPIIDFALSRVPAVRGVHFQPVSYFGRYPRPPSDEDRLTLPEIIREIEIQTGGRLKAEHFFPSGCENAYCSFHGNVVLLPDGGLKPWPRAESGPCCSSPQQPGNGATKARRFINQFWSSHRFEATSGSSLVLGGWEEFSERLRSHTLCLSAMAFQDAWNLDLARLRECCVHVMHPEGRLVPFCAYNLTDRLGRSYYRAAFPAEVRREAFDPVRT